MARSPLSEANTSWDIALQKAALSYLSEMAGGGHRDAFSRLRVADPTTLFSAISQLDDGTRDAFFHKTTTGGSSAHLPAQASVQLSTDDTSGASILRQSQRYIPYQPGKSQALFITFDAGAVDGGTFEAGYGDDENGVFFQRQADGTAAVILRSSASGSTVETVVAQTDWNLDPMDGTGPSGQTLNATKAQIFFADLQWLAVGRVRVGFDIDGALYYAHQFFHANRKSGVYMTTARLPVRWKLEGNGNATSVQAICCAVISEGGFTADLGHMHATPNGVTAVSCPGGVATHVVSIRPKATFNGIVNRGEYIPSGITHLTETKPALYRLLHGCTVTGGTWTSADDESGIEYNVGGTVSGGHLMDSDFGVAGGSGGGSYGSSGESASNLNKVFLTLDPDGAQVAAGTFSVVALGLGGTASVRANIHWTENK